MIIIVKKKIVKKKKTIKIKKFTIGRGDSKIMVSNIKRQKSDGRYQFKYTMDLKNVNKKNKITSFVRKNDNVKQMKSSVRDYWFGI